MGNVKVLEWAHKKGHEPEATDFVDAAIHGQGAVLQWAEENNIDWFSDILLDHAILNGHVCILEWIHSTERVFPVSAAAMAASVGQRAVLNWMKEHDLLGSIHDLWQAASVHGHTGVLDWLFDNGYRVDPDIVTFSIIEDRRDALLWAREHGLAWDASTCTRATLRNNLPLLQWLRENDCPWDCTVVAATRLQGNEEIEQWAIDNGCPTE